ncbi:uncharacterized protein Triagg1_513 [Trichoderma aggressivum f. europaeum]|uniref:Nucleoside phosphorylase domain-containing protein n=1 Tax=Trichoderma aggressivum f. europaeum TaxID=173218 RepID=A0AAE1M7H8_9HYPO|nr:hypothetical protein Triagg1_513 [Trichoderma aggressivum f. europaeum]
MDEQPIIDIKVHNEYTVGWVCALPKEQTAATAMLDQRHGDLPKPANDSNTYTLGSIGKHNIVIACLPKGHIGNTPAATVAAQMVSTFPSVRFGLMVGIGGGIPPKVRLGDVVVSTPVGSFPGVVQWDRGKAKDGGFEQTGSLNNPPVSLLTALAKLETEHELVGSQVPEYLDQMKQKWPRLAAKYLKSDSLQDVLFKADCSHVCQITTGDHVSSDSTYESEKEDSCQHCDKTKVIKRKPRDMRVHYGLIASGNQVIKSAAFRDQLNKHLGGHLLCVEMEAAGLMNNFPCIVIRGICRGICDYADSHKNKDWQEYAAAVAAAFAKELLAYVSPSDVDGEHTVKNMLSDVSTEVSSTNIGVSYIKSSLDNDMDRRILEWVTSIDYGPQQSDFLRRREPGTGQWLIDSTEYQDWLGAKKQTLFCPGIPGAGKTILTSIVVDHLERTYRADPTIRVAYIYCNYRRQEEQSIDKLLASLLKQLSQGENCISNRLRGFYKHHIEKRTQISLLQIQTALHSLAENYSTVFIVIDALDECQNSDGSRQKFITELFNLQKTCGWNLFLTSRAIPEIADRCSEASISLEIRASAEDIERYLKGNTGQLPAFVQQNEELQQKIAAEISQAVDGMFLLAQIYLNSLNDKMTPKAIKNALSSFQKANSGLGETKNAEILALAYEQAMLRINGQQSGFRELAHNVLLWIVCAERQLTIAELQHALAVEIDESEIDEENIPSTRDMVSVCAGLVTVDYESSIIRLVHYTAQEYFSQTRTRWFPDSDMIMTDICASYLLFRVFEEGPMGNGFRKRSKTYPLYSYAAQNWGHHARKASKLRRKVMEFLECETKIEASIEAFRYDHTPRHGDEAPRYGMTGLHLAAYFGLGETAKALLEKTIDVNTKDECGSTPLSWSARKGHETVVKLLLAMPNIDIDPKGTSLLRAAEFGHGGIVESLLVAGADPNVGTMWNTPLSLAAYNGHEDVVKLLLATPDIVIHSNGEHHDSPLYGAVDKGHTAVVGLLLAGGAEPDLGNTRGTTPLMCAADKGDATLVEMLLAAGADPNLRDCEGNTTLGYAVFRGHDAVAKLMLAAGADVNSNPERPTLGSVLHLAVMNVHEAIVELLLAAGANPEFRDISGHTPLWYAASEGYETIVKLLLEAGADFNLSDEDGTILLHSAAFTGSEFITGLLLDAGVNPHLGDEYGSTALHMAAENYRYGSMSIIGLFLEAGVKPDVRDNKGRTPLCDAASVGFEAAVDFLLAAGADPNLRDEHGETPLHAVFSLDELHEGHEATIKKLLAAGADPNLRSKEGITPLSMAQAWEYEAAIELLSNKGASNEGAVIDSMEMDNDGGLLACSEAE